jgi:CheY-like chemotaxis protein
MYQSCKNVLIPSHGGRGGRSEFGDSVAQQPVRQTSLDSRAQQNLSSESGAIPSLLSLSPRGRKTASAGAGSTGASASIATSGNAWTHEHLPLGTSASASGAVGSAASMDSPAISQLDLLNDQAQGQGHGRPTDHDNDVVEMEQYVPIRILVVDDAPTALKITTRVLTKIGYEVTTATNGLEAVDLIKDLTEASLPWFDAIILDIQMPIMDGLEACQKIRAMESKLLAKAGSGSHTSRSHGSVGGSGHQQLYHKKQLIVAVSVNADAESRVEAINSGFDYFMAKPFRVDEFETLLNAKELSSKN